MIFVNLSFHPTSTKKFDPQEDLIEPITSQDQQVTVTLAAEKKKNSKGRLGYDFFQLYGTVDGWNPANQLRLVVYPIIYRVSAPSQVVQVFSHQQSDPPKKKKLPNIFSKKKKNFPRQKFPKKQELKHKNKLKHKKTSRESDEIPKWPRWWRGSLHLTPHRIDSQGSTLDPKLMTSKNSLPKTPRLAILASLLAPLSWGITVHFNDSIYSGQFIINP